MRKFIIKILSPKFYNENKVLLFSFFFIQILTSYFVIMCCFFEIGPFGFFRYNFDYRMVFLIINLIFIIISFLSFIYFPFLIFFFSLSLVFFFFLVNFNFSIESLIFTCYLFDYHKVVTPEEAYFLVSRFTMMEPWYYTRAEFKELFIDVLGRRFTTEELIEYYNAVKRTDVELKPYRSFVNVFCDKKNKFFYPHNTFMLYYNENISQWAQPNVYSPDPINLASYLFYLMIISGVLIYFFLLNFVK